jgi:hypothetical protein
VLNNLLSQTRMAPGTSGQPESKGQKKTINIGYELAHQAWDFKIQQGSCRAKIPSNIPRQYDPIQNLDSVLIFDLMDNSNGLHCLEIMTNCLHKNILHAPIVQKKEDVDCISVWHEPYTGNLLAYLESTLLGAKHMVGEKVVLPTPVLQNLISQVFDGLKMLRLCGKYHGNFTLEKTYYYKKNGNEIIVKLANFEVKDQVKSTPVLQAKDCQAVGDALRKISKMAKDRKDLDFDCSQIDSLAEELREFSFGDLCNIEKKIGGHPFFWVFDDRKFLLTCSIPLAMNKRAFRQKIEGNEDLIALPWDKEDYDGLINLMMKYRADHMIKKFDINSRVDYVLCVSGMYAHEKELKVLHVLSK